MSDTMSPRAHICDKITLKVVFDSIHVIKVYYLYKHHKAFP